MKNENEARLFLKLGDPEDGDWHLVLAGDEQKTHYSYRFEGGKKGRGHLSSEVCKDGPDVVYALKLIHVRSPDCKESFNYELRDVKVSGDAFNQITTEPHNKHEFKITNTRRFVMQGYYNVIVWRDDDVLIQCDPMISNDPKA